MESKGLKTWSINSQVVITTSSSEDERDHSTDEPKAVNEQVTAQRTSAVVASSSQGRNSRDQSLAGLMEDMRLRPSTSPKRKKERILNFPTCNNFSYKPKKPTVDAKTREKKMKELKEKDSVYSLLGCAHNNS